MDTSNPTLRLRAAMLALLTHHPPARHHGCPFNDIDDNQLYLFSATLPQLFPIWSIFYLFARQESPYSTNWITEAVFMYSLFLSLLFCIPHSTPSFLR